MHVPRDNMLHLQSVWQYPNNLHRIIDIDHCFCSVVNVVDNSVDRLVPLIQEREIEVEIRSENKHLTDERYVHDRIDS